MTYCSALLLDILQQKLMGQANEIYQRARGDAPEEILVEDGYNHGDKCSGRYSVNTIGT